ncbi:MAG: BatD family protein [Akkermansiaceae bacterium]
MVIPFQRVFRLCALFVTAAFIGLSPAIAAEVTAELDRESVPAGNGAILTLRVAGGRAAQPQIPEVKNLIVQPRGQNQQIQIVNGRTSISVSYQYMIGSQVPGDYEIPAIEISVGGEPLRTQPLKLKVLDAGAAQPPAGMAAQPSGTPPAEEDETGEKRFGFLTVDMADSERKHAYVGEIAPVRIRAWLPENSQAQLRSGIQPEGKAFTLHNVSNRPQQSTEIKDGKRYTVVTWYGGMSAAKAGSYPASLSVDATVAVRDTSAPRPRQRRGGPFDDPFFDSILNNMHAPMIQKDVTLKSDDQEIEVRPLPVEGRPEGFTGAVGDFKFEQVEIPNDWVAGEPQQIGARLGGSGNFALMKAPQVLPPGAWRTYPAKDQFAAGDEASFAGNKTFQFSAVPRKAGAQELSLAFSFFDPGEGIYKTVTSPVKPIQVSGADLVEIEPDPVAAVEPAKPGDQLVAQKLAPGPVRSLEPFLARPGFAILLVLAALLGGVGRILAWLRRRREDPRRAAAEAMEKATREAMENARRCAEARDVPGFFNAARLALQQRLGARWNQPPQAITSAEVGARISSESPVAAFFREADLHEYSRQSTGEILPRWRALLDEALASLTPAAKS